MYQLPREIVQLVIYYCRHNQDTLATLNSTNHDIYDFTLGMLYHAPSFTSIRQFHSFVVNLSPKAASKVHKVDLKDLPHRWDVALDMLVRTLVHKADNINYLDLCLCRIKPDVSKSALEKWPLQYLSLNAHHRVDDELLVPLSEKCLNDLREVDLGETNITDQSLIKLADHCPKLESLDLEGCQHVTEVGIEYLTKHATSLKYLNVKGCFNIIPGPNHNLDGSPVVIDWAEWELEEEMEEEDENA